MNRFDITLQTDQWIEDAIQVQSDKLDDLRAEIDRVYKRMDPVIKWQETLVKERVRRKSDIIELLKDPGAHYRIAEVLRERQGAPHDYWGLGRGGGCVWRNKDYEHISFCLHLYLEKEEAFDPAHALLTELAPRLPMIEMKRVRDDGSNKVLGTVRSFPIQFHADQYDGIYYLARLEDGNWVEFRTRYSQTWIGQRFKSLLEGLYWVRDMQVKANEEDDY